MGQYNVLSGCTELPKTKHHRTTTLANSVYSEGLYFVKALNKGAKVLTASFKGLGNLEYNAENFIAILQPQHIE